MMVDAKPLTEQIEQTTRDAINAAPIYEWNYKMNVSYAVTTEYVYEAEALLDTGAGVSCVALEDLPTGGEEYASSCPAPTLSSTNGITTPTAGLVPLWVMFGGYVARIMSWKSLLIRGRSPF